MKQKLSGHNRLLIGFTLFSMFFGAGNLIFPPFLGAMAGERTVAAMAGFLISAVGLPVLGVAAVAISGGLPSLAGRVDRRFAFLFVLLVYLSIGPCLAIPRTASTSFEMAVLPYISRSGETERLARLIYSIVFFCSLSFPGSDPGKRMDPAECTKERETELCLCISSPDVMKFMRKDHPGCLRSIAFLRR